MELTNPIQFEINLINEDEDNYYFSIPDELKKLIPETAKKMLITFISWRAE